MHIVDGEEGRLIRVPRSGNSKRRFRPGWRETRNSSKTSADFAAERQAAKQRWAGVPPLVAARGIIAEADLPLELLGQISAVISEMPEEQLAGFVNSGELARQLAELAAG